MDIASVFEWFAQESVFAAELTHEQPQRETWNQIGRDVGVRRSSVPLRGSRSPRRRGCGLSQRRRAFYGLPRVGPPSGRAGGGHIGARNPCRQPRRQ
jgi:hypothetical protein